MILTSNRADEIDHAFKSRIHVTICYPELSELSRRQIWTQFLVDKNLGGLSQTELEEVSGIHLNGREIKNVIKISNLLAQDEGCAMGYRHVKTVLDLTRDAEKV